MKDQNSLVRLPPDRPRRQAGADRQGRPVVPNQDKHKILNQKAEALRLEMTEAQRSLEKLVQAVQLGREKNLAQIKTKRRQIARLQTFLRQKEIFS